MNDPGSAPLRVVIADDHPLVRSGLRTILTAADGIDVVGEASTGAEAVAVARTSTPDVIVMDLQMPGIGGIEATRHILHSSPHISVLVLSMFDDDDSIFAAPRPTAPVDAFPELTGREKEILALVAQHQTNPEIARRLHLSPKTIRNHVSNVFTKLQVADRAEAIIRAREGGLGRIER